MDTAAQLEQFILSELVVGTGRDSLPHNEDLLTADILDSAGIAELLSFLESDFGIQVSDDELQPDNFRTISAIADFVERKRAG
jgi:acyl carrier protein